MNANEKQGGDGSPQLDLDAIEREAETRRDKARARGNFALEANDTIRLVALVRRLQQENEELREALRAIRRVLNDDGDGAGPAAMFSMIYRHTSAALARVVPEKETP